MGDTRRTMSMHMIGVKRTEIPASLQASGRPRSDNKTLRCLEMKPAFVHTNPCWRDRCMYIDGL